MASEEESPAPSCSHLNSESSVPEDLGSLAAESVPSETLCHGQPESPDQSTANEEMVYSEEFKSSASPGKLVSFYAICTLTLEKGCKRRSKHSHASCQSRD